MFFKTFTVLPGHFLYVLHIAALFAIAYQIYKIRKNIKKDIIQ